ncbi:hypothetical protein JX265_008329 [Neoarthrinium moseri]|uniref:EthD domain-containing protein n=1 Tax=Neoarthrinium moseri TaxID=1658444 RepID=A0A9P9WI16_9PEZI|nr:hypothetical protein JX265_008329 [Neoarthrinium moseri]
MSKLERVLRLAGTYRRSENLSEKQFYEYISGRHGVECAKIHAKYGVLKYQMAFNTASMRALADSMRISYRMDDHDVEIEYYFKDAAALVALSADKDFQALHIECLPYVQINKSTATMTWIEVYVDNGELVNISSEGKSLQPSFEEQSSVEPALPVANYHDDAGNA